MAKKRKKKSENKDIKDRIIETMIKAGRPLFRREILHLGHFRAHEKDEARKCLNELVKTGKIILLKGNRYGLSDLMPLVTGTIVVHPQGFGFLHPEDSDQPDVFIPASALKGAVHGDKVVVRIERKKANRLEGSVLRILERGLKQVIGTFFKGKRFGTVIPEDERLLFEVIIPKRLFKGAKSGQIVIAEIEDFEPGRRNASGRILKVLGDPEDLNVQTQIVIHKHQLPHKFSPKTLKEAEALGDKVDISTLEKDRKDIRALPLVTIDGENARDFDDAVFVKKTRLGYTLTVAIADVSYYVPRGCALDLDAFERGTSVYFPNAVVPMFPEALSNNLCSLVPNEDRLCVCVRIFFDKKARVRRTQFFKGIMRSHKRFTYDEVKRIIIDNDSKTTKKNKKFVKTLLVMAELAKKLRKLRIKRGSIDFDLPEPYVVLGITGNLEDIVRRERNLSHILIEEFMIAANEAVANFLTKRNIPTLYRVHEEPDIGKIKEFVEFVRGIGINIDLPEEIDPLWCQKVLKQVQGTPQEYVVNTLLLRTMKQAVYSPENIGHFGLASKVYLHFTSPIRRYPDLIVHRILKANLKRVRKRPVYSFEELEELGRHCSSRERVAMEAEREMLERLKVRFMADKIGQIYTGVISAVTSFGFFVELQEVFVEGAVRLVDLADDYYIFDQAHHRLVGRHTHKVFQIGQVVKVKVKSVDIPMRHINFELVEESNFISKSKGKRKQKTGKKRHRARKNSKKSSNL